jgi:lipoprotein-anchoring transpeptidase ErfK/SrfK
MAAPRPPRGGSPTPGADGGEAGRASRRAEAHRRSRRRVVAISIAALLLIGGGAAFALSSGGGGSEQALVHAKRVVPKITTTTAPAFQAATTLTSNVDELVAYQDSVETSPVVTKLSKTTDYKQPRTLLAVNTKPGWWQVLLPIRPASGAYKDGMPMGWVKDADVIKGQSDFALRISVSRHYLALFDSGKLVLETEVAVGKPETPTPLGKFYITDPVDLTSRPNGAYGAYALGISAFSEVLKSFNGGPGQIAVHGNGQMNTVGQNVSNGCIRVFNDVILQIAKAVPLGTPVTIEA